MCMSGFNDLTGIAWVAFWNGERSQPFRGDQVWLLKRGRDIDLLTGFWALVMIVGVAAF